MSKDILLIADAHIGSPAAPFPVGFQLSTGAIYQLNIGQLYLNDCFGHMVNRLPPLDGVVFVGDIIDGKQIKDGCNNLVELNMLWQVRAAREMFKPVLAKLKPDGFVYVLEGTDYHEGPYGEYSEAFGEWLNAKRSPDGHFAWSWLRRRVEGMLLDISHHTSYFMRNRSGPLDRELGFAAENATWMGEPDAIIRAHTHVGYRAIYDGLQLAVSVPSWELQTRYAAHGKMPNRMISRHIGSVLIRVDARWKARNLPPVQSTPLIYPHPKWGGEDM